MSTWRNTQALGFLTTASKLGLQGFLCKRESKFSLAGVYCDEWDHCYLDFVVETSHSGSRDSIRQLNCNTAFKG